MRKLARLALAGAVGAALLGPASAASATSVAQVGNSSVIAARRLVVAGPGNTYSAPSVAQVGNSSVIAADTPNRALRFYWQTIGGVPWHPEHVAGAGTTFG